MSPIYIMKHIMEHIHSPLNTNPNIFQNSTMATMDISTITGPKKQYYYEPNDSALPPSEKEISLLDFSRLYKIGKIPVIDFIIIYILLYSINSIYFKYDYKIILIVTIPITIIFNLFTNPQLKLSTIMLIILILSIFYLFGTSRQYA